MTSLVPRPQAIKSGPRARRIPTQELRSEDEDASTASSSDDSPSSSSSRATIRADRESDQGSSSSSSSEDVAADLQSPVAHNPTRSAWQTGPLDNVDLRSRSISAPNSRSSSFARNLDQLALQSQSAHRFPAVLSGQRAVPQGDAHQESVLSTPSLHNEASSSSRSSSVSSRSRKSSQSEPSSPQLQSRRNAGNSGTAGSSGSFARPRSSIFSSGSGFTPALPVASFPGQPPKRSGRMRSTSASEASCSPPAVGSAGTETSSTLAEGPSTQRTRHRSQSARTSPVLRSLQPLTPTERNGSDESRHSESGAHGSSRPPPQRTRSVPHLAHVSPIVYGLGVPYRTSTGSTVYAPSPGMPWDSYFALPPSIARGSATQEHDECPPPYTPSGTDLVALANVLSPGRSQVSSNVINSCRTNSDEEDDEEAGISFSARRNGQTASRRGSRGSHSHRSSLSRASLSHATHDETRERYTGQHDSLSNPPSERHATPHSLTDSSAGHNTYLERLEHPSKLRQFVLTYLLHPLRLLAAIPGCVGTVWLLRNAAVIYVRDGTLLFKEKQALRADIVARPSGLEFALSALWSLATAYHALSFTTLLLRRWLHYYSLLPSLIRLVALQAICWPLVRLTLHILGPLNPLPAWVIISSTTAFSDTVARWVVSNITDESTASGEHSPPEAYPDSGTGSNSRRKRRFRSRRGNKTRRLVMSFWRTIMGAPPQQSDGRVDVNSLAGERGFITESEADGDSEVDRPFWGSRRATAASNHLLRASLRRRVPFADDAEGRSELTSGPDNETDDALSTASLSSARNSVARSALAGRRIERVGRIFHWDVAVKRNLLPICIMAYMTMWALLIEVTRSRW